MLIIKRFGTISSLKILLGESLNCTTMTDTCLGSDLPVVRKKGTPCQRLLSTNNLAITNVSVVERGATFSSSRYPGLGSPLLVPAVYCPRTTFLNTSLSVNDRTDLNTLVFASRISSGL